MPFAIDDLTSVIAHWSADAIVGLVDGDPVDALPDSISSWDLAGTTTTRPLYRPTSSINSLPAVEFDGVDDWLKTATTKTMGGSMGVACVVSFDVLKTYNVINWLSTVNGNPAYGASSMSIGTYVYSGGYVIVASHDGSTYGYVYSASGSLLANTNYILTLMYGYSDTSIRTNGFSSTGNASAPKNGLSHDVVSRAVYGSFGSNASAGARMDGLLSESVIWNESIDNESFYIEGVLAHKYGITLPTTHPFYAAAPTSGPPTGAGGGLMKIGQGGGYNG
jgi:hypothetical protein